MNKEVLVILPALNEEKSIANTIWDVRSNIDCQVVVLDGHSEDRTAQIAIDNKAYVMTVPRGKGNAVKFAIKILGKQYKDSKYWIMIDSDFTYPAKHIPEAVKMLDKYDVVIGYRKWKAQNSMTFANKIGNIGLSMIASTLYGYLVKDVCTGFWAFRSDSLQKFELTGKRFTLEADLFCNAIKGKCKVAQFPIEYRARLENSKSGLKISDGIDIALFLFKKSIC